MEQENIPVCHWRNSRGLCSDPPERIPRPPTCPSSKPRRDRLSQALADVDEEELVAEFKPCAGGGKAPRVEIIVLDANILIRTVLGRRVRQIAAES